MSKSVELTAPRKRRASKPASNTTGKSKSAPEERLATDLGDIGGLPEIPDEYRPSPDEPFMNDTQLAYFRNKLIHWRDDIVRQTRETIEGLNADTGQHADIADRATSETDRALELRARDRQRKLISKINSALKRIEDGSYGYCEETGEPISLRRLEARPIATLSIEAQERHEKREKVYRDD